MDFLEDVSLAVRSDMWLHLNGAPGHWGIVVGGYFGTLLPGKWIGRDGPVQWSARSPDLNPLDSFMSILKGAGLLHCS